MRLPFLRPKPEAEPVRPARSKAERARQMAQDDNDIDVETARTRARRRLVGALVLLVIGIVGFPVLFETTPRPLPLDTPFEVPRREGGTLTTPSAATPAPARVLPVPVLPADANADADVNVDAELAVVPAAAPPAATPARAAVPAAPLPSASTPAVRVAVAAPVARMPVPPPAATSPAPAPREAVSDTRAADAARARALLDAAASTPAAAAGRFVVQVGAYTDAAMLREARAKVEKLGLKTYTQVIENDAGKRTRLRLGPYATRAEADAAAAKVKHSGLPANVITL